MKKDKKMIISNDYPEDGLCRCINKMSGRTIKCLGRDDRVYFEVDEEIIYGTHADLIAVERLCQLTGGVIDANKFWDIRYAVFQEIGA